MADEQIGVSTPNTVQARCESKLGETFDSLSLLPVDTKLTNADYELLVKEVEAHFGSLLDTAPFLTTSIGVRQARVFPLNHPDISMLEVARIISEGAAPNYSFTAYGIDGRVSSQVRLSGDSEGQPTFGPTDLAQIAEWYSGCIN